MTHAPVENINSRSADFQKFEVLRSNRNKRHRYRQFLVEGVRSINGAVAGGWTIDSFLYARGRPLSRWAADLLDTIDVTVNYELAPPLMEELSGKGDTSELLAIVRMREEPPSPGETLPLSDKPLLVLFDRPSNKGNLGTVFRSCDALGADGLILTGHGVDPYDPDVAAASMGSFFRVPFAHIPEHDRLRACIDGWRAARPGFTVLGTSAHAAESLPAADLTVPALFMIGNETDGLSHALTEMCDRSVVIPMAPGASASSLNVGCAATVLLYEAARQRGGR